MDQSIRIRRMELKDLVEVIRVCNQAFAESARITQYIAPRLVRSLFEEPEAQLVAEVNDKVVGFLRGKFDFKGEKAVVAHIAVHPKYQRKGISSKLIKRFEEIAVSKGLKKVSLGTPFAKEFYEKLGYKCVETTYAVVYSLIGREVVKPGVKDFKVLAPVELDGIPIIVKSLKESDAYEFLLRYFETYRAQYRLSALVMSNSEVKGIVLGREHEWIKDLLTITYLYGLGLETKTWLLEFAAYKASIFGVVWVLPTKGYHSLYVVHPLSEMEVEDYPWPEIDEESLDPVIEYKKKYEDYCVIGYTLQAFERLCRLFGFNELFKRMIKRDKPVDKALDKLFEITYTQAKLLLEAGVDEVYNGDDVGAQNTMLMFTFSMEEAFKA